MSEEEDGPAGVTQPIPEPQPVPAGEADDRPANVLGGIFVLLFGICITLTGGTCASYLTNAIRSDSFLGAPIRGPDLGIALLMDAIALVTIAGGIIAIRYAYRLFRGGRRR